MTPELHRPVRIARIGPDGFALRIEASPAECAALAERMLIPTVHALTCTFHLRREGDSVIAAQGHLHARVVQTCVVRFVPAGEESDDPDPEADDELPYEGDVLDLGEAAAEQLGLALDPYPKMPGAVPPEADPEADPHPFAPLASLRKPH